MVLMQIEGKYVFAVWASVYSKKNIIQKLIWKNIQSEFGANSVTEELFRVSIDRMTCYVLLYADGEAISINVCDLGDEGLKEHICTESSHTASVFAVQINSPLQQ